MSTFEEYLKLFGNAFLDVFMKKASISECLTEIEQESYCREIVEKFFQHMLTVLGKKLTKQELNECLDIAREFIDRKTLRNEKSEPSGFWFTESDELPTLTYLREKMEEDYPISEGEETPFPLLNDYLEKVRKTQGYFSMEQVKRSSLEFASIIHWIFEVSKKKKNLKALLLGNTQIGKTTRMNALIQLTPYLDVELVIIFAGTSKRTRKQNQRRTEEDVIGFNPLRKVEKHDIFTITQKRMGKTSPQDENSNRDVFDMVTKQDQGKQSGDALTMYGINRQLGQKRVHILVVKKEKTVLKKLHDWLFNQGFTDVSRIIVLDDESDVASNDRPNKNAKNRKIASSIKKLLNDFPNHIYLGITATAAAVFFGNSIEDCVSLYPEYVQIINEPPGYISPFKIFEIDEPEPEYRAIAEGYEKYDFIVKSDDIDIKKTELTFQTSKGIMEPALVQSILYFFMTGGLLRLRGADKEHHAMMIHIKTEKEFHKALKIQIDEYIKSIHYILLGEKKDIVFWNVIIELYREEVLEKKEHNLNVYKNDLIDKGIMQWEVEKKLSPMQKTINEKDIPKAVIAFYKDMLGTDGVCTYIINSDNNQTFSYEAYENEGFKGILIGALTIGRALTLQGNRVSYYDRQTHAGDTSTQNMRWTGYHSHRDLIRVFLRDKITKAFQAAVSYQFNLEMKLRHTDRTAVRNYILSLDQHTKTNVVPTNKMGGASLVEPSNFTKIQNVAGFGWDKKKLQKQKEAVEKLANNLNRVESQGLVEREEGLKDYVYRDVDKQFLLGFLEDYPIDNSARFKQDDKENWLKTAKGLGGSEWEKCDIIFLNVNKDKGNGIPLSIGVLGMANQKLIIDWENELVQKVETKLGRAISQSDRSSGMTLEEKACAYWLYIWLVKVNLSGEEQEPSLNSIESQIKCFQEALTEAKENGGLVKFYKKLSSEVNEKKEFLKNQTSSNRIIPREIPDDIFRFARPNVARLFIKVYDPINIKEAFQSKGLDYPDEIKGLYGYYLVPPLLPLNVSEPKKRYQVNREGI